MAISTWNILGLSCCVLIFCVFESNQRSLREKRQTSQMDPLLRAVCTGKDGSYSHPYSCGSYIQCYNQTYSEADCPGNMYFNSKLGTCDFRRKVKCRVIDGMVEVEDPNFGPAIIIETVDHPVINTKPKADDEEEEDSPKATPQNPAAKKA